MKKLLLLCLLFFFSFNSSIAQNNWGGGVDDEQLHFGFKFQYISSEYKIQKVENWKGPFIDPFNGLPMINSQLRSLSSPVTPGFGLGFVSDFRLGNNANLRFAPGMVFADVIVNYEFENPSLSMQRIVQGTLIDLPLGIKLKSDRRKNFRAYVIGHFMAIQEISIVASMGNLEISTVSRAGATPSK